MEGRETFFAQLQNFSPDSENGWGDFAQYSYKRYFYDPDDPEMAFPPEYMLCNEEEFQIDSDWLIYECGDPLNILEGSFWCRQDPVLEFIPYL